MTAWKRLNKEFNQFLKNLPMNEYEKFRENKTVEQDLKSNDMPDIFSEVEGRLIRLGHLHLSSIYKTYWIDNNFISFEKWFEMYWNAITSNRYVSKELWGFKKASCNGARKKWFKDGYEARMYRTWISVLTQLQFSYLWNSLFKEKVESSVELDHRKIDAQCTINHKIIGIQIKKVTSRKDAMGINSKKNKQKYCDVLLHVPYSVCDIDSIERKSQPGSPRVTVANRKKHKQSLRKFNKYFEKYSNGFFVFSSHYLDAIHKIVEKELLKKKHRSELDFGSLLQILL